MIFAGDPVELHQLPDVIIKRTAKTCRLIFTVQRVLSCELFRVWQCILMFQFDLFHAGTPHMFAESDLMSANMVVIAIGADHWVIRRFEK